MTAEERLAYFQGEKRRTPAYREQKKEKNHDKIFLKIKFMIAVILFVLFLSMDYTGYKIHGIGSEKMIEMVGQDFKFLQDLNL